MSKILQRMREKSVAELVLKAHQAFQRLPYESNRDRLVEDIGRILASMKVCCEDLRLGCCQGRSAVQAVLRVAPSLASAASASSAPRAAEGDSLRAHCV